MLRMYSTIWLAAGTAGTRPPGVSQVIPLNHVIVFGAAACRTLITRVKLSPDREGMFDMVNVVLTESVKSNTVANARFSACDAAAVAVLSLSMYLGILRVSDHSRWLTASPAVRGFRAFPVRLGRVVSIHALHTPE